MIEFEWDETKRQRTIKSRGLDFITAGRFFDGRSTSTLPSPRDGEARWKTTTLMDGAFYTLVWLWRGEIVRVISLRRAHEDEETAYRALHG